MMSRRGLENIARLAQRVADLEEEAGRVRVELYDCIVKEVQAGETYRDIAPHARMGHQRVSQIVNERRRRDSTE